MIVGHETVARRFYKYSASATFYTDSCSQRERTNFFQKRLRIMLFIHLYSHTCIFILKWEYIFLFENVLLCMAKMSIIYISFSVIHLAFYAAIIVLCSNRSENFEQSFGDFRRRTNPCWAESSWYQLFALLLSWYKRLAACKMPPVKFTEIWLKIGTQKIVGIPRKLLTREWDKNTKHELGATCFEYLLALRNFQYKVSRAYWHKFKKVRQAN